jgi:hypothetical protein
MKNQYFGDVNDYRKYGLLRVLRTAIRGKFLVAWMLTPNDGGSDGKFRNYLEKPDGWRGYDPDLYDELQDLHRTASKPEVSLIERSGLLHDTKFYSAEVPDKRYDRAKWSKELFKLGRHFDLVFVDPDNGIEVPSKPVGRKGSSKYVIWNEIEELWAVGCSVLIYQHFPREPRYAFTQRMLSELAQHTNASLCKAFRTSNVLFLLAAQERHQPGVENALSIIQQQWVGQIEPVGLAVGLAIKANTAILKAASFAAKKHRAQKRKDAEESPYIGHPLRVAELIADIGGIDDPEIICAALLHDTIEDTDATYDELQCIFGEKVTKLVREVTDDKSLPKQTRKELQIEHAPSLSAGAVLIKLADKCSNVYDLIHSPPHNWSMERKAEYLDWAEKVISNCPTVNVALEDHFTALVREGRMNLQIEAAKVAN